MWQSAWWAWYIVTVTEGVHVIADQPSSSKFLYVECSPPSLLEIVDLQSRLYMFILAAQHVSTLSWTLDVW
jgi:hypothetical protein